MCAGNLFRLCTVNYFVLCTVNYFVYVRVIILSYVRSIIPCRIVEEEYGGIFAWGAVVDNKYVPVSVSPRRNHHRGQRVLSKDCLIYYMSIFCFLKYTQNELQLR